MTAGQTLDKQEPSYDATSGSPLTRLSALFKDDMKQVNGLILEHMQSDVPLIPQLAQYLIMAGGKRIRPLLTIAAARLAGDTGPRSYKLAAAVEFIHTATLLHDDVVDDSDQRRGQDSAPLVFGNQATVLVGDFLFSRAFELMVSDGDLDVLRVLSHASAVIAEGEVLQLQTTKNIDTTIDEYERVIGAKTAALFAAACEIGPIIAKSGKDQQEALRLYGHHLGMAFQIADDILDYQAEKEALGKDLGDDFREGKMTAPVILSIAEATVDERHFWERTMAEKSQSPDDFKKAVEIMQKHDALTESMDMAKTHVQKARDALSALPTNALRDLLEEVALYTIERAS